MRVKILIFGQLTDITGESEMYLNEVSDIDELIKNLVQKFPTIADSNYAIAVDNKVISQNIRLNDNCIVALLPPFSGG